MGTGASGEIFEEADSETARGFVESAGLAEVGVRFLEAGFHSVVASAKSGMQSFIGLMLLHESGMGAAMLIRTAGHRPLSQNRLGETRLYRPTGQPPPSRWPDIVQSGAPSFHDRRLPAIRDVFLDRA